MMEFNARPLKSPSSLDGSEILIQNLSVHLLVIIKREIRVKGNWRMEIPTLTHPTYCTSGTLV